MYDDKEGEACLPVRRTAEIARAHQANKEDKVKPKPLSVQKETGINKDGKELFDFVLKGLASPDNQ